MSEYLGNLECPDLRPHFKHLHWRPMTHAFGRLVASDWADKADNDPAFGIYKNCGLWCREEAAILYNVAKRWGGRWVDIGAHTGWTTAHIAIGGVKFVDAVDPMLALESWIYRFWGNAQVNTFTHPYGITSRRYFGTGFASGNDAYCIDGDHEWGEPLADAKGALAHFDGRGLCIFHDFIGAPVQEAVLYLMDQGFYCRIYNTPHMIALCWRQRLTDETFWPPDHIPDPAIDWKEIRQRCKPFPFERTI